ncbi:hypothetical protein [Streptomyces sp. WAC08401]|nr:hypothetical protein [Streptomyces sp. WAC08401]
MPELWITDFPEPRPDAVRLDAVADDDFGVIVRAVASDGREVTAAESW